MSPTNYQRARYEVTQIFSLLSENVIHCQQLHLSNPPNFEVWANTQFNLASDNSIGFNYGCLQEDFIDRSKLGDQVSNATTKPKFKGMASEQTATPEIDNVVYVKLPEFGVRDPRLWFAQLEAIFESRRITSQSSRYNCVVGCLPHFVAREVSDLTYTRPSTDPYDALKTVIVSRTASSDEQNLRKLLSR
ncbi:hypothetical protein T265_01189 [Opisthorchis viverrini]|uniref:DUF7041 domain-containing protein n=1 Tax=Opisthorchis viverrini TaxID=6198 RepID=A0A075A3Q2_OPIVI|nr:hypothetical protein T265_01189 [Opisthorchis viverrini]KER32912.1 hypothetical protein T265_01189 [Opisthorchis viverrini]